MPKQLYIQNEIMTRQFMMFIIGVIGFIGTFYISDVYLKLNFYENGEAYYKGLGHLLNENRFNGIIFLLTRNLFSFLFLFIIVFSYFPIREGKALYKPILIISGVIAVSYIIYILYELSNISNLDFYQTNRLIEISLTWPLKVIGLFVGYNLYRLISKPVSGIRHSC